MPANDPTWNVVLKRMGDNRMRFLGLCIATALLVGCAAKPPAVAPKTAAVAEYGRTFGPRMVSGEIPKSLYYKGLYHLLSQRPVSEVEALHMKHVANLVDASEKLEAGTIDTTTYESIARRSNADLQVELARVDDRLRNSLASQQQGMTNTLLLQQMLQRR
ncbi:hypothetical protein N5K27_22575 [Pigmentiphaga sp. GD03639]|uniref:hypothetical protein n=1 Tax=Pigmentiphaga sp. GD03639 TaxID=2975354 RepID=UPI0024493102|nr:hypothetical protein [Pigmentiphaga sp. GD03639]MDH2239098.1 hypothetical protein [Pigmentiphaga sp. GD03639]